MSTLSADFVHACVAERSGPVALHLRESLEPVEGAGSVFFPPTYAGGGYQIDTLADGTRVATVDSVGSQANRMEPLFCHPELAELVPQITIAYTTTDGRDGELSLLDAGHRLGDAVVRSTELQAEGHEAFQALLHQGDASRIATLAPTSLVFGAWDSRDTQAKVPRIVQSVIRAYDVSELKRSAQFVPALDYASVGVISETAQEKAQGSSKDPLAQRGFVHVPATDQHGGVIAHGGVRRDLTINLVALRRLEASDPDRTLALRRYVLGLCLVAALEPQDRFLRQGCLLVPSEDAPPVWRVVRNDGRRDDLSLDRNGALALARTWAAAWGVGPDRSVRFDKKLAQADAKKKK